MIPIFKQGWLGGKTRLTVSSPMGMRNGRLHNGVDFAVPVNTKIYAPIAGQITKVAVQKDKAGLYVKLRFTDNTTTYDIIFAHLHRSTVLNGQSVKQGDLLGYTGGDVNDIPNCGRTTGPHLHFEIRRGGIAINPLWYLSESCVLNNKVIHKGRSVAKSTKKIDDPISNYKQVDVTSSSNKDAIEQDNVVSNNTKNNIVGERLAPGIWQITKLIMDSSVSHRQIFDSSISMQTGPLGNFFNKICQQPLVELSGDTFGDQYYFIVRKPPFDKEGMKKMQDLTSFRIKPNEIISTSI